MSKHTPGPWRIGRSGNDYPYKIEAMDGRGITSWRGISRPYSAEGEANARLISAAPELLYAAELAESLLRTGNGGILADGPTHHALIAAIAKAKGESA